MNTTSTVPDRVHDFVTEVARHFDDLPDSDRSELLDDLEQHLLELAAEDEATLDEELTDPATYAAEVRLSAGFPEREAAGADTRLRRAAEAVSQRVSRTRQRPLVREFVGFLPELRPAWWVLRGWVAVAAPTMVLAGGPWWRHVPVPGRNLFGLVAVVTAATLSVRIGREARDRRRAWRLLDAAAGVAVAVLALQALTGAQAVNHVEIVRSEPQMPVLRHPDGEPITNLHLFDADGEPLEDVYVYDGIGRPVHVGDLAEAGFGHIVTDYPRDRFGNVIANRYPQDQYLVEPDRFGPVTRQPRPAPQVPLGGLQADPDVRPPPGARPTSPEDVGDPPPDPARTGTDPRPAPTSEGAESESGSEPAAPQDSNPTPAPEPTG